MKLSLVNRDIVTLIAFGKDFLSSRGVLYPERESKYLLFSLLEVYYDKNSLLEELIDNKIKESFYDLLKKRGQRYPLSYLEKKMDFYGLNLHISPGVFIPRQETELLVDNICVFLKNQNQESLHNKVFWDVCCGSGCIGLAIKNKFPQIKVFLSDISDKAVELTKINASKNNLSVEVLKGNLFEPFKNLTCDYFCCNPPYLSYKDIFKTDPEVRCFEPWVALVGGPLGTEFYSKIAPFLFKKLKKSGAAWMEIGYNQGSSVKEIFKKINWKGTVLKDFSNNDRFFFLEGDKRDVYSR